MELHYKSQGVSSTSLSQHNPLMCPTSKNYTHLDLVSDEGTILCLFFCHHRHCLNKVLNYIAFRIVRC
jgi:hypothetical protein